ncbi:MAG: hypothetical protein KAJ75_05655 [Alphaproteobacteria bacterium]|nr:hypothetical protein [Alphaproteobacteria bacterium]
MVGFGDLGFGSIRCIWVRSGKAGEAWNGQAVSGEVWFRMVGQARSD